MAHGVLFLSEIGMSPEYCEEVDIIEVEDGGQPLSTLGILFECCAAGRLVDVDRVTAAADDRAVACKPSNESILDMPLEYSVLACHAGGGGRAGCMADAVKDPGMLSCSLKALSMLNT